MYTDVRDKEYKDLQRDEKDMQKKLVLMGWDDFSDFLFLFSEEFLCKLPRNEQIEYSGRDLQTLTFFIDFGVTQANLFIILSLSLYTSIDVLWDVQSLGEAMLTFGTSTH